MTVSASPALPQSQVYLVKHTFINVAEENEDPELFFGTPSRGRSRTWDESTFRTASPCSVECNGEDICDTASQPSTSAASGTQESHADVSTDETSSDERKANTLDMSPVSPREHADMAALACKDTGADVIFPRRPAQVNPTPLQHGVAPVPQLVTNEHGQMNLYCMGFVPRMEPNRLMSVPQNGPSAQLSNMIGSSDDFQQMATALMVQAAQLRAEAEEVRRQRQKQTQAAKKPKAVSNKPLKSPTPSKVASAGSCVIAGDVAVAQPSVVSKDERTTIMLRNLPNDYMRDMVADMLDSYGFTGKYNFIYVPVDFQRWSGFGYAFVNMVSNRDAQRMHTKFQGFKAWKVGSVKVCDVSWGEPLQGLASHIERYRNSPVMHYLVPDEFKPAVYEKGQRAEFPSPTKRLRPPRDKCGHLRRIENNLAPSPKSVA